MSRVLRKKSEKRRNVNIIEFYFEDGSIFRFLDDDGNEVFPEAIVLAGSNERWIPKSEIIKN